VFLILFTTNFVCIVSLKLFSYGYVTWKSNTGTSLPVLASLHDFSIIMSCYIMSCYTYVVSIVNRHAAVLLKYMLI